MDRRQDLKQGAQFIIDPGEITGALVVAIDGPAGAGKSTVARALARQHHLIYIDSGAMYRCVALKARRLGLSPEERSAMARCASEIRIEFLHQADGQRVLLDGEDVTGAIRENEVSELASQVSTIPEVREAMTALQRELGRVGRIVMEGRDIGTVVFPGAAVKIFLTASLAERAGRRSSELAARTAGAVDPQQVEQELSSRDRRDSEREFAPLVPAADAITIDTGGLTVDQVVEHIGRLLRHEHSDEE